MLRAEFAYLEIENSSQHISEMSRVDVSYVHVRGCFDVKAHALMFAVPLIPDVAQGCALEDEGEQETDAIGEHCGDDSPADVMEARRDFFREDAEVEEDDGDFRGDDHDLIEPLLDVEVLCVMLSVL